VPEGEHYNPPISPSGRQVIYIAGPPGTKKIQVRAVDWDGSNDHVLTDGYGLWVWRDPATALEYACTSNAGGNEGRYGDLVRLDQPETRKRIYSGQVANRFSVSADGTRAFGEFLWPNAGMLYPRNGQVDRKEYRTGCTGCIAPDNSYRFFHMGGVVSHGGVIFHDHGGTKRRAVSGCVTSPGVGNPNTDSWVPRWTTDASEATAEQPNSVCSLCRAGLPSLPRLKPIGEDHSSHFAIRLFRTAMRP